MLNPCFVEPKKTTVKVMSDLRPVALTSTIMKVFERVVLSQLQSLVADFLDPLQSAYRRGRRVEDAFFFFFLIMFCIA